MPGRNTGTNTIVFIKKNQVPQNRAKDVTYGLITCLIRPEKIEVGAELIKNYYSSFEKYIKKFHVVFLKIRVVIEVP